MNNRIFAKQVRLIDEVGKQRGIVSIQEALSIAQESGLDLVEVAQKANPPVCRIMDYGKYKYREVKNQKQKIKNKKIKSIRIRLATSEHDIQTKIKNAHRFLKKGHKVRVEIQLRGREKAHYDLARERLQEFIKQIDEKVKIDQFIKKSMRGLDVIVCRE
ncbi:MAG: translation initiation factor IF-3 [bacterium]